jgi:hypothetical protein
MSCGTGRISRGNPPKTKEEKEINALRALNEPSIYKTVTKEEYEEIEEYLGLDD